MTLDIDAPIRPREAGSSIPLTGLQLLGWSYLAEQAKPLSVRVCARAVRVFGQLHPLILERSVETVVHRHESLRTRIVTVGAVPTQHVDAPSQFRMEVIDLTGTDIGQAEAESRRMAQAFLDERIDISADRLFDARLWKLSESDYVFILAAEHMIADGFSYSILSREIWDSYNQAVQGVPLIHAPLPIQFPDYAVWLHRTYTDWKRKHESYWTEKMTGVTTASIPPDKGIPDGDPLVADTVHISLGSSLSARMREIARRDGTPLNLLILAVYGIVLSRWCGRDDLVLTYVSHGRQNRPELGTMIGFIVNWLYLRIRLESADTFQEFSRRMSLEVSAAFEHMDFNRVLHLLPECRTDLEFHWQSNSRKVRARDLPAGFACPLRMQPFGLRAASWTPAFWPVFFDNPAGVSVTITYRSDLFYASTVEKFGNDLRLVANEYVEHPTARVGSVWPKMR